MMFLIYHPVLMPLFMAILGAIFGSFIAALVGRWPQDGSVLHGRSHCDGCGRTLRAYELVPVISWIAQRGRCRMCGDAIGRDAIAIELIAMVIGGGAMLLAPGPDGILAAIFGWLLLPLVWLDLRHYWLPDRLTALLAAAGLAFAYVTKDALFIDHVIGGAAGFMFLWLIALGYWLVRGREGLGGGDPKIFGAIGLWLGWQALPFVLLGATGVGLVAALVIARRGGVIEAESRFPLGALLAFAAWPMIFFVS